MKGGRICEVISGMRTGKYAQVPNNMQEDKFAGLEKVFVIYFEDEHCEHPVKENGQHVSGLTSIYKLKLIGYYD